MIFDDPLSAQELFEQAQRFCNASAKGLDGSTTKVSVRTRFGTQKKARSFKERVQSGTPLRNRVWVR